MAKLPKKNKKLETAKPKLDKKPKIENLLVPPSVSADEAEKQAYFEYLDAGFCLSEELLVRLVKQLKKHKGCSRFGGEDAELIDEVSEFLSDYCNVTL